MGTSIALVGERRDAVVAHRAIPLALARARAAEQGADPLSWEWLPTAEVAARGDAALAPFDAIWCVPGSPYASTEGALAAVRFARERGRPFLGTCGGFQHALMEHVRSHFGVAHPAHAELEPGAADPVIAPLACSLAGERGSVRFVPGSRIAAAYGAPAAEEAYHCRYGLSARWAASLAGGPLRPTAHDSNGELRAVERDDHPFFVATLYQPERAALEGRAHPLIAAFVTAARSPRC